jgi:hypothetical protein
MDAYLHTAISFGCIFGAYYAGVYIAKRNLVENIVGNMLDKLETDGYLATVTDKDGEKDIVSLSEIRALAVKDALSKNN